METSRYLVEVRRPLDGWQDLRRSIDSARAAADEPVRFLRSIFVPEDDACFLLYEGPSAKAITEAVRRASLEAVAIAPVLREESMR